MSPFLYAQEQIAVKMIDGVLLAESRIMHGSHVLNAHLIIDIGLADGVVLHRDAIDVLEITESTIVTVQFDGAVLSHIDCRTDDLGWIDNWTNQHGDYLDEKPVWGIVGLDAFTGSGIKIDMIEGLLEYGDIPDIQGDELGVAVKSGRYIAEVEADAGYVINGLLTSAEYESIIDTDTAALAGNETGDLEHCMVGGLNLRAYSAVRVRDDYSGELDIADISIGTSFLQNFIVYFDRGRTLFVFEKRPGGTISDLTEQTYFNALAEEDVAKIIQYLDGHPESRLAEQAETELLGLASRAGDRSSLEGSIRRFTQRMTAQEASVVLSGYVEEAIQSGDLELVAIYLEAALDVVKGDRDHPLLAARLHARQGWLCLELDQLEQGRASLITSLFLNPDDGYTNYLMGRLYEKQGVFIRAWARYIKCAVSDEPVDICYAAIKRISEASSFTHEFSHEQLGEFLEGYVFNERGELNDQAVVIRARCGERVAAIIDELVERHDDGE